MRGEKKGNAKLSITMNKGSDKDCVSISIIDTASGAEIVKLEVDPETFSYALTGHGRQPCLMTTKHLDRVGLVRKTVQRPVWIPAGASEEERRNRVYDAKLVGEEPHYADASNPHRMLHKRHRMREGEVGNLYQVTFWSWEEE